MSDEDDLMEKDTIWSQLDDDQEEVRVKNIHRFGSYAFSVHETSKSSKIESFVQNKKRRSSMQEIRLVKHKRAHNRDTLSTET